VGSIGLILRISILIFVIISSLEACPYCAGQTGESYVQQVIFPIACMLLAPFIIIGIVVGIIWINKEKQEELW